MRCRCKGSQAAWRPLTGCACRAQDEAAICSEHEQLFDCVPTAHTVLSDASTLALPYIQLWLLASDVYQSLPLWKDGPLKHIDAVAVSDKTDRCRITGTRWLGVTMSFMLAEQACPEAWLNAGESQHEFATVHMTHDIR